jgi:hypothetical protein
MRAGNFLHFPERPPGTVAMVETKIFIYLPKKSVKTLNGLFKKFIWKWQQKLCEQMHGARVLHRLDKSNELTKEGPLSFVFFESSFTSVSTVSRGHPSIIVSLFATMAMTIGTPGLYLLQQDHGRTLKEVPAIRNTSQIPADLSN